MSLASTGANPGDLARCIDRRPFESPVGLKMVVPGWPQFSWGQHQRGWVLVGSFAMALAGRALDLGNLVGLGFLRLCVHHPCHVGHRRAPARFVPDLSQPDRPRFSSRVLWHCYFIFRRSVRLVARSPGRASSPMGPGVVSWSTAGPITVTPSRTRASGSG